LICHYFPFTMSKVLVLSLNGGQSQRHIILDLILNLHNQKHFQFRPKPYTLQ
jgi:hypothetical protein